MAGYDQLHRKREMPKYERSDVRPQHVVAAGIALAAMLVVVGFAMWGLLLAFEDIHVSAPVTPVEQTEAMPPPPRLQENPTRETVRLRREAESVLTSYGWVNRDEGVARIPIEEAMRRLAQEGWPSQARPAEGR